MRSFSHLGKIERRQEAKLNKIISLLNKDSILDRSNKLMLQKIILTTSMAKTSMSM